MFKKILVGVLLCVSMGGAMAENSYSTQTGILNLDTVNIDGTSVFCGVKLSLTGQGTWSILEARDCTPVTPQCTCRPSFNWNDSDLLSNQTLAQVEQIMGCKGRSIAPKEPYAEAYEWDADIPYFDRRYNLVQIHFYGNDAADPEWRGKTGQYGITNKENATCK